MLFGKLDQTASSFALHVGRIDHREPRLSEPPAGDEVQNRKRVRRRRLVVLVISHKAAAEV